MGDGLVLQNLITGYAGSPALLQQPLSLEARPSEIWMLGGRNGTGKSTLLTTMAGLTRPLSGKVFWNNTELNALDPASLSRIFSLVLTVRPDAAHFMAGELVETGLFRHRISGKDKRKAVDEYLHQAGASHLKNRKFEELSDGEKQRVMMARALAQQTPVLLLDEPSAYLDFAARTELSQLLQRWAGELNKLIFVSSHDHHALIPVCSQLLFLDRSNWKILKGSSLQKEAFALFTLPGHVG